MLKKFISAFLVFRLELQPLPLDWGLVLLAWLRRPLVEILLQREHKNASSIRRRLHRKLDEVYPF